MSQEGRRHLWMTRELFLRLKNKMSLPPMEEGMGNLGRVQRSFRIFRDKIRKVKAKLEFSLTTVE